MKTLEMTKTAANEVCVKRSFDAPISLVWRAFTEPALIQRWMTGPPGHTMPICEMDARVGGSWRYVWKMPEGEMEAYGQVKEIVLHERIVHTETFAPWPDQSSLVTTEFTALGDRTLVTTTMAFSDEATRDMVLRTGMTDGMESSYARLETILPELRA